jgi:phospholipase D1/2
MHWQYRTICRGPNSILKNLYDVVGSKAHDYISFYGLRAHGRLGDGGPLVTNQVKYFLFEVFCLIVLVIALGNG